MDLSLILWIGGMIFSLGVFAVKVGFGLSFSRMKWKGILLTLSFYFLLFIVIAMLSGRLIELLEPLLREGPYLHALMATIMIAWGIYLIKHGHGKATKINPHSMLLLIPCPVCLTAITFSVWAGINAIKLPSYLVGLGLGLVFTSLSLIFMGITRLRSSISPHINLGLSMIGIGIYFLGSLIVPAKIEEAKGVYESFLYKNTSFALKDVGGVLTIMLIAMLIGFFVYKRLENRE